MGAYILKYLRDHCTTHWCHSSTLTLQLATNKWVVVRGQEDKFTDGCLPQEWHCHQNVQTPAAFKSFQMLLCEFSAPIKTAMHYV